MARLARAVLIADSDRTLSDPLHAQLVDRAIPADAAVNGAEAMRMLDHTAYAVAVIDVTLPGANVEHILRRIAGMTLERPVVILLASNPSTARSLDVNVVQIVLRKPAGVRQIVDLVDNCIRNIAPTARPVAEPPAREYRAQTAC